MPLWTSRYVKIRPKIGGAAIPFIFNKAQVTVHNFLEKIRLAGHPVRVNIVKGRKQGISTYIAARFLHRSTLNRGVPVFILAHISQSTDYLFKMVKRMYYHLPDILKPSVAASNKIELRFGQIDSEYALGSAESKSIGRGMTPILLHCSEAAFYSHTQELQTGLIQGVPKCPGSEIIYESTANGTKGMFYGLCMKGVENKDDLSRIQTLFIPWFWQLEYRVNVPSGFRVSVEEAELMEVYNLDLGQIAWRRSVIEDEFNGDLWMFRQEYPLHLLDAFVTSGDVLVRGEFVEVARKLDIQPDPFSPKVLGVDGADSGNRTVLVLRQGKKILWYKIFLKMKPMTLAGIVAQDITKNDIDMVFLDVAYGYGARDRLRELGFGPKTQTVHFGETPLEPEIYRNKRAQMFGYTKEWFEEGGADIPDDNLFGRDIMMMPAFEQTGSRGLLSLPSKITIKKENAGISPDIADATALTFAYPVMRRQQIARVGVMEVGKSKAVSIFKTRRQANQHHLSEDKPSELFIRQGVNRG